jgi:hypothetical protein
VPWLACLHQIWQSRFSSPAFLSTGPCLAHLGHISKLNSIACCSEQGLGSPVFNKLEAELGRACLSLPATKGFEIGSGFEGAKMTGSEHNDEFYRAENGEIRTRTNRSGGVQGGISNGEIIYLKIAFKPTSTITVSAPESLESCCLWVECWHDGSSEVRAGAGVRWQFLGKHVRGLSILAEIVLSQDGCSEELLNV